MQRILPISELTLILKGLIEDTDVLQDLWVDGEISNLTIARSGHAYFSLKDSQSQFRAVMWRNALQRQRMVPREGDRVIAHGGVTVYQPRGEVQLQVDLIQPQGTGLLQLQLEELRMRLEAEGIFEPSRKRSLPDFPSKIGVVSSASGAVWHDIQQVIARRYPVAELVLAPTQVQGDTAPPLIVAALQRLIADEQPDVVIIGRGGGSIEDLWAFNDERVVRAVFACPVPIVSAVGHETDTTLTDFAADLRAPTPSAAAELVAPDLGQLDRALAQTLTGMKRLLAEDLNTHLQRLDDWQERLQRASPAHRLALTGAEVTTLEQHMQGAIGRSLQRANLHVDHLRDMLAAIDPQALLARGYAFIENHEGRPVRSVNDVQQGETAQLTVVDGAITTRVESISPISVQD